MCVRACVCCICVSSFSPALLSCCGAGTAADTEYTTEMISSQLELHRLSTGRKVKINVVCSVVTQILSSFESQRLSSC